MEQNFNKDVSCVINTCKQCYDSIRMPAYMHEIILKQESLPYLKRTITGNQDTRLGSFFVSKCNLIFCNDNCFHISQKIKLSS